MKILVFNCDIYADVVPAWWACKERFWADCPYEVEFVTNSVKLDVPAPVHYIRKGDMDFGWRLRRFIENHYNDHLLLFMMADYLIKHSDQTLIAEAEKLCWRRDVRHVRLRPMPPPQFPFETDGFGRIDKRKRYSLSLQPGIWETETLYKLCSGQEDPWQTEVNGSRRVRGIDGLFLSTDQRILEHKNYYRKGKVDAKMKEWVRENVREEAWPEGVK